jgi:phosphoribosyl 1,2-cyclic phosphate phosphodiesterase
MIGCDCAVCRSTDARDTRFRPSIVIDTDDGQRVLVDTTPDLRSQALAYGLRTVDAVLFTHTHADHIMGLDEVRRFNVLGGRAMPCFGDPAALAEIRRVFAYVFDPKGPKGGGIPALDLWPVAGPFCFGRQEITPVPVLHGDRLILGFRLGRFAYLTDCSGIPEGSFALLAGLDVLVLDALRHRPHPTHFTVAEATRAAERIGARQTYFTHICHHLGHAETCAALPPGIALAHDGLTIEISH